MIGMKIILIVAAFFLALIFIKKFVFNKIFLPIVLIFLSVFIVHGTDNKLENPKEKNSDGNNTIIIKTISMLSKVYIFFDIIECLLLFSFTTAFLYCSTVYLISMLPINQLLSSYLSVTLTLIISCYISKFYSKIYILLDNNKKLEDNDAKIYDGKYIDVKKVIYELRTLLSKRERYMNMLSENNLKLIIYVLAFFIIFIAKLEDFSGIYLINNIFWIDFSKVALESSVTFIAFDRFLGQLKKITNKE